LCYSKDFIVFAAVPNELSFTARAKTPNSNQFKILKKFRNDCTYTGVPELAPQRKQACADNKKDSKLTKINFLLAQITELQSF
jgi:hypothetical protein